MATVKIFIERGTDKVLSPFSLNLSNSISNPERNISNINPNIARPEMNSEILTIPSSGHTKIPYAIS